MKKIILVLSLLFIFISPVKADLTKDQENDIALFATNFINEGNKRIDKNGYPLLAYMQGQARIDGFQSKLYKITYDYNHKNYVNAYKWTFDCSSFASFIYYHTFNLVLTYNKTGNIDSYSGLPLRSPTANPYQVSAFVEDADKGEHFYYIKKGVNGANINLNDLKKGDLLIYVGHHIMVYVGNGNIAEATVSCISKNNLGMQVIPLTSKYSDTKLSVIRIKDRIIPKESVATTNITWLDTNETVDLVQHAPKEEEYPKISYNKPSEAYNKSISIEFQLNAVSGLKSYSFSESGDNWIDISGNNKKITKTILNNGTYYFKVKDQKGLTKEEKIVITTIDNIKPIVKTLSVIQKDNYSIISVVAEDLESGLADNPYSFDRGLTWVSKNTYDVNIEKEYIVSVKDKAGNIIELPVKVKINNTNSNFPLISDIIFGEVKNDTKKVTIVFLNCPNCQIAITKNNENPLNYGTLNTSNYITYLKEGNYRIHLKDDAGNTLTKSFKVEIPKKSNLNILIFIVPITVIGIGIFLISKRKTNEI